ncbi:DUF6155 family protein [Maribacter sp. 2307ULW6-5]|uniref:DUF6155 family protein n=1 Tax=Maribacter sp. 2307ULW6-5 TaxID=3386275 RepID=UPI0039BC3FA2
MREVKSELNKLDKEGLIKHISELYKKYKPVKEYFDYCTNPDEDKLLQQYKEKVTEGFFPKRGHQLKLSIARKAINDFKKLGTSPKNLADMLFHFVENSVQFTKEYGDVNESFYTRAENTYANALKLIDKNGLLDKFEKRAHGIVNDTKGMGWGFHDCLGDLYHEFYP